MTPLDYVWAGILAVFQGPEAFNLLGMPVSISVVMVTLGLFVGIVVGATAGLGQVMALAIALPILISVFGFNADALLPVLGFMIGIMKGSTVGGAVPSILFNTPGTPDAYMTTLDGFPMAQKGQADKALRVAHLSSVSGDTFSDIVLFICAPFLAVLVEAYLDLPEKTALIILSLSFIAAVVGTSPAKGLLACGLGLFVAFVGTGEDFYPRLTLGWAPLSDGFPVVVSVVGTLVIGAVFYELDDVWAQRAKVGRIMPIEQEAGRRLAWAEIKRLMPFIGRSAVIGTGIGALPGIGSVLAATLGYASGKRIYERTKGRKAPSFGQGAPEGIAATEAANSSVTGANLIPVLSLGIPGNTAAVFLILAMESIGGLNPGPSVFKFSAEMNTELVAAFGLFTLMVIANLLNWTIGGRVMRSMGVMVRIPKHIILPVVLVLSLTALYVQETEILVIWFALGFGILGYILRKLEISPLPFVIAVVLARPLEATARQAFSATGGDPYFLLNRPIAFGFIAIAVIVVALSLRSRGDGA